MTPERHTVSLPFTMEIEDVYRLSDGRTILVGAVDSGMGFVSSLDCALLVDGREVQRLVVSEELPEKRSDPDSGNRAVGTADDVSVADELFRAGRCRLVGLAQHRP